MRTLMSAKSVVVLAVASCVGLAALAIGGEPSVKAPASKPAAVKPAAKPADKPAIKIASGDAIPTP